MFFVHQFAGMDYSGDDRTITLHEIDGGLGHSICIPSAVVHQKKKTHESVSSFFVSPTGIEEAGLAAGGAKKCPVDTFLGRGRFHVFPAAARRAADENASPGGELGGASRHRTLQMCLFRKFYLHFRKNRCRISVGKLRNYGRRTGNALVLLFLGTERRKEVFSNGKKYK